MDITLEYDDLNEFILNLLSSYAIVAPKKKENRYVFDLIRDPSEISIHYDTTLLPPVKWIYPDNEILLEFNLQDIEATRAITFSVDQILLFVHPCDINAINMMDEIMAEEPVDANYLARRNATTIIGYECLSPCKDNILCFDKGYHIAYRGFDLFFTDMGHKYFIQAITETGERIVKGYDKFRRAGYSDWQDLLRTRQERKKRLKKTLRRNVDMLSHLLKEAYEDNIWEAEGKKCLSCGACNIVCPTCYCFDVVDEICPDMDRGTRYRRWDGCQLHGFCKVASGENFRSTPAARLRHRVFKKEVYLKKRFGWSGCVGCGRCIDHCIANISIIDIYNRVMEKRLCP